MVVFPNAKINLGLSVSRRRDDGYHEIETCFFPIPLYDVLESISSENLSFVQTGDALQIPAEHNICLRAYQLLANDFSAITPLSIHLHKIIPAGAGLGGGSADASFMLRMMNDFFSLHLSNVQLEKYALQLGSDCPFFINNVPALAQGRGEILQSVELSLKAYRLILIYPKIHISTAEAFSGITPTAPTLSLHENLGRPIGEWKNFIFNDFEKSIFQIYPQLKELKDILYNMGATYASMSGSGSALYGLFSKEMVIQIDKLANEQYWILDLG